MDIYKASPLRNHFRFLRCLQFGPIPAPPLHTADNQDSTGWVGGQVDEAIVNGRLESGISFGWVGGDVFHSIGKKNRITFYFIFSRILGYHNIIKDEPIRRPLSTYHTYDTYTVPQSKSRLQCYRFLFLWEVLSIAIQKFGKSFLFFFFSTKVIAV